MLPLRIWSFYVKGCRYGTNVQLENSKIWRHCGPAPLQRASPVRQTLQAPLEIRLQISTSRVPPFKVTQGHWNQRTIGTRDFLLMFRSNHGYILYRFRGTGQTAISVGNRRFSPTTLHVNDGAIWPRKSLMISLVFGYNECRFVSN